MVQLPNGVEWFNGRMVPNGRMKLIGRMVQLSNGVEWAIGRMMVISQMVHLLNGVEWSNKVDWSNGVDGRRPLHPSRLSDAASDTIEYRPLHPF